MKVIALLLSIVVAMAAFAQNAERPITEGERRQLGQLLPHLFDTLYVHPETGKKVAEQLRAAFANGRYDSATNAATLATMINDDLAAANDKHVSLRFTGKDVDRPVMTLEQWKARTPHPPSAPSPLRGRGEGLSLGNQSLGNQSLGNISRVEILEGNVGYLKMRDFRESDETRGALSAAMALLANTDAMIVDVRNCPGGSADAISYLASYFFEPGTRVLMNRYNRPMNRSFDSTTVDVPGKRMPNTPLYVLTGRTGSACESLAFTLQQWGRAKTVGEKTSGAGNNNMLVDLGAGLTLSISVGTATHPKTQKGFEGVGVLPDIAVAADRALEVAHAEARRKPRPADPVAEVRALEREWLDAYEKRDADAMKRIVADDFTIYFEDGSVQTKADILAMISRGAGKPGPAFFTEDVQARAYGDTVVLTGRVVEAKSGNASRYTDTYVRRDGRWQVVASHLGKVK
jgi:ketosteroid isomerase-like protein